MNDPSDLTQGTIQKLFFNQMKVLSRKACTETTKLNTFDMQFGDAWL